MSFRIIRVLAQNDPERYSLGMQGDLRPDTISLMPFLSKVRTAISSEDFYRNRAMADKGRPDGGGPPTGSALRC